jgi:hypothetical protein
VNLPYLKSICGLQSLAVYEDMANPGQEDAHPVDFHIIEFHNRDGVTTATTIQRPVTELMEALTVPTEQTEESTFMFRWVHLPMNNINWVEVRPFGLCII